MAELCTLIASGQLAAATAVHHALLPWMEAAFCEPNPMPAKAALAMMGKIHNVLRLPLLPLLPEKEAIVRAALAAAGTITSHSTSHST